LPWWSSFQLGALVSLLPLAALGEVALSVGVLGDLRVSLWPRSVHTFTQSLRLVAFTGGSGNRRGRNYECQRRPCQAHSSAPPPGRCALQQALIVAGFGALGPTIAAAILSWGPWQWLFLINLPIGLIALGSGSGPSRSTKSRRKADALSIVLNVVGLFSSRVVST